MLGRCLLLVYVKALFKPDLVERLLCQRQISRAEWGSRWEGTLYKAPAREHCCRHRWHMYWHRLWGGGFELKQSDVDGLLLLMML